MKNKLAALTFEAGGNAVIVGDILNILSKERVRASIFIWGEWADGHPDLVRRMAVDGHEFGNHTYTHPDLRQLSDEEIEEELRRTDDLVRALTGRGARPWLRPPFGGYDQRVERIAQAAGCQILDRKAIDGKAWPEAASEEAIARRSAQALAEDGILTYHLDSRLTRNALPEIIATCRKRGYRFATLSELTAIR